MIYYKLTQKQLEEKAEELLRQYDKEMLYKTKELDVYSVIEKCLDVPYDWKYITPDQSILGLTAFNDGYIRVWPKSYYKDGILPTKLFLKKGTIVIDSTLTESDNRGRENFTVMHEVFHQVIHKKCFRREPPDYAHSTTASAIKGSKKQFLTPLDYIEYQANACAAAFLMPRELLTTTFSKYYDKSKGDNPFYDDFVCYELSHDFNVSKTAMKYRLQNLKLL